MRKKVRIVPAFPSFISSYEIQPRNTRSYILKRLFFDILNCVLGEFQVVKKFLLVNRRGGIREREKEGEKNQR